MLEVGNMNRRENLKNQMRSAIISLSIVSLYKASTITTAASTETCLLSSVWGAWQGNRVISSMWTVEIDGSSVSSQSAEPSGVLLSWMLICQGSKPNVVNIFMKSCHIFVWNVLIIVRLLEYIYFRFFVYMYQKTLFI